MTDATATTAASVMTVVGAKTIEVAWMWIISFLCKSMCLR
jgi:hypothetical protein